jgi:hypothetical protein
MVKRIACLRAAPRTAITEVAASIHWQPDAIGRHKIVLDD